MLVWMGYAFFMHDKMTDTFVRMLYEIAFVRNLSLRYTPEAISKAAR